ncbi:S-adenosyl-L-methionine-dependent methyltransferase [Plenodomus tracheiphilus IPT5]|uniref:DNA (cytosine-5-)-methyltransferase n=1 Tax=Plenodomus tracheiphilus IPT5 TaxID=1408161 RepID=A0A6A7B1C1_9PLEO|nr:S-adenosyl-L-methionine-dependent methyltransferase [Plenodomus tracheiphilus IPT5]
MLEMEDTIARINKSEGSYNKTSPEVRIDPPLRDFARSHSINWRAPDPVIPEGAALQSLKTAWQRKSGPVPQYDGYKPRKPFLYVDLTDFELYRSPHVGCGPRKSELVSLHHLEVPVPKKLCFDGFLCVGNVRHFVQGSEIHDCSIEGYGDDKDPSVVVYLQSQLARKDTIYDVWYKLVRPTREYRRYHEPFLWIAQLGKHVIDYLGSQPAKSVNLESFRHDFIHWLFARFAENKSFKTWHLAFRSQLDFRVGVHAYLDYTYHQAFNLANSGHLLSHPLWRECMIKGMTSVKPQPQVVQRTLATPDVFESFQDMYFGANIQGLEPSEYVAYKQERRKRKLGFTKTPMRMPLQAMPTAKLQLYRGSPVRIGDVVAIKPDEIDRKKWRNSNEEWLAYVHDTTPRQGGLQELSVLWLYHPCDTNIFKADYPFNHELFFSDNCNCSEATLLSTDVIGRYNVQWLPSAIPSSQFFVRQTYVTRDSAFVTWRQEHTTCVCRRPKAALSQKYRQGDTVYLTRTLQGEKILDPTIVWEVDDLSESVTVRKLLRLGRDCADLAIEAGRRDIALNELVLTDEYVTINASRIQRECSIRFIPQQQLCSVPSPYDRGGAGDRWFVSMSVAARQGAPLRFLSKSPKCFREASEVEPSRKLKGLSIFSGGGSLDRGIEEGGAVEFHTAVDFSPHAIHTQKANARDPNISLYCGSVDDYFKAALRGINTEYVATIGKVEFIAAGSPCPGFSSLQPNPRSEASLRNASHISTFCSFVDLYRPLYGVLENVVNMASTRTVFGDKNVLSSVVACLVSMGYQVNQYIMDSWNYGSAQHRSRILLSIAAPGLTPISQPWHTHSRKYEDTRSKCLGMLPNGERLGEREYYPTPFMAPSAGQVTADLPDIGNANVHACIQFPDHRVTPLPTFKDRSLVKHIPKSPPGCGYREAVKLGLMPKILQRKKTEAGRPYNRVKEASLIPCITTKQRIADAFNGAAVHWAQDRPISIMEARRAQGYLDHEPIIGTLPQQFEIVGNGVDRMVSLAFGLSLRQTLRAESTNRAMLVTDTLVKRHFQQSRVVNESDDDGYLTDVVSFAIDFEVEQDVVPRTRAFEPMVVIPAKPKAGVGSARLDQATADTAGKDHASKCRSIDSRPGTAYVEQTLTQTFTTIGTDFTVSTASFSRSASILLHTKRPRENDTSERNEGWTTASVPKVDKRKRTKTIVSPRSSSVLTDKSTASQSQADTRATSTSSTKSRRTRHSGLGVEFVPVNWNKKVEMK